MAADGHTRHCRSDVWTVGTLCRQSRGRGLLGAGTQAVGDEREHDSQPQPGAQRVRERGGIPPFLV